MRNPRLGTLRDKKEKEKVFLSCHVCYMIDRVNMPKSDLPHPLPDDRLTPPRVVETNFQRLRALLAWLHMPESASAVELGCSVFMLRSVLNGTTLPDLDFQQRAYVMSRRWPHGLINIDDWPRPISAERRGKTKGA